MLAALTIDWLTLEWVDCSGGGYSPSRGAEDTNLLPELYPSTEKLPAAQLAFFSGGNLLPLF